MKILFLSRWFPYPADNGAKLRIFNLLKTLARRHDVSLLSFIESEENAADIAVLKAFCVDVQTVRYRPFTPDGWKARWGYLSMRPRSVLNTYSPVLAEQAIQIGQRWQPDLVIASEIDMAPYALYVPAAVRMLEEIELGVLQDQYHAERHWLQRTRRGLTWWKHARYVAKIVQAFDGCTVVSELEQRRLAEVLPHLPPICVIPNGVDVAQMTDHVAGPPMPNSLIYSGALTYHANFDAVDYFLRDIFPLIRAAVPAAQLAVTGRTEGVTLTPRMSGEGITFTGYLPDVRPKIAGSRLSVVPLRVGGGTRLKILESLALGTPVVTTYKGVEGLDLGEEQGVLTADTPQSFAQAVITVLTDADLRADLSRRGLRAVSAYDWQPIGDRFEAFLQKIMGDTVK